MLSLKLFSIRICTVFASCWNSNHYSLRTWFWHAISLLVPNFSLKQSESRFQQPGRPHAEFRIPMRWNSDSRWMRPSRCAPHWAVASVMDPQSHHEGQGMEVNPESIMGDPLVINRPCLKWDFPMKKSIQRFLGYLNLWTAPICFYTNSWSNLNDLAVHPWHPWLCKHPVDFEMGQGPGCENSSFSDRRAGR